MKKAFNLLLALVAVIGFVSLIGVNEASAQYVKRTLIEQHTGAWCGWCVDGSYVMDEIIKKYPDKVIGIKVHNGDAMALPEQGEIGSALGLTGFPTGNINRTAFNVGGTPTVFLDRGSWLQATEAVMNNAVEAGLETFYSFDPATREVVAIVNVEFVRAVTGEVRLNALVIEDKVTGTGAGYDQHNYLSGMAGYETNPYYSKPSTITGYEHMKVVRSFMGGAWGQANSITGATTAGKKYSYSFKYTLPAGQNPDNISVIGVVEKYTTSARDVLNCIKATKVSPQLQLSTNGDKIQVKATTTTGSITCDVKNISGASVTITAAVNKSSRTPSDWTVEMEPAATEFVLAANETKTVTLKVTPGATKGMGDGLISFKDKNNANAIAMSADLMVVSSEINRYQVIDDAEAGAYSLASNITAAGYSDFFDVSSSDFNKFASALSASKSIIVWSSGELGDLSAADATSIGSIISAGGNVLINGAITVQSAYSAAPGLLSTFGFQFIKSCFQGYGTFGVNFKGYAGDPITDGFTCAGTLKSYLTPAIRVTGGGTSAIIRHSAVDTISAVKTVFANSKGVWIGFNPAILTNATQKQNLIKKALDWLEAEPVAKGPQITFDQKSIAFDAVNVSDEKNVTIVISNTGDKDLTISSIQLDAVSDPDGVFTIKSGGSLNPINLAPGLSRNVFLNFKPTSTKSYVGKLLVKSNSLTDNDKSISLSGEGISAGAAKITSTKTTIRFTGVLVGKTPVSDVDLTNDGLGVLNITNIAITDDADGVFTILSGSEPATLASGESKTISVKFIPTAEKTYTGNLTIASNASNSPELKIPLQGTAITLTVPEEVTSPDGVVNVKVFPNPMTANGVITYNITSNEPVQFNMYIVDINGRKIADLVNTVTIGSQTVQFDASSINSGTYFIVAGANTSVAKLPFIIAK